MRLSTVILPIYRRAEAQSIWARAEALGFHAAYTYDHLAWRSFADGPWFATVPTLASAAQVTSRMRLGTMVASPNFRHPVTLAKDLIALDDLSDGRITLGLGAGGSGFDATVLGQDAWTPRERGDRLAEFVPLLDELLRADGPITREGRYYEAVDARMMPGCVQRPRLPLHLAATGPRGLALVAAYAEGWITYGDPRGPAEVPAAQAPEVVRDQLARLRDACGGELPANRTLLQGSTAEHPLESVEAFRDYAGTYADLGITEIVIHWPVADSVFAADATVFEQIAIEGLR